MTLARRGTLATIAPAPTDIAIDHGPAGGTALPLTDVVPPDAIRTPEGVFRRCVFRRIDRTGAGDGMSGRAAVRRPGRYRATAVVASYEVMCLYLDVDAPRRLGDLAAAYRACAACQAPGLFRPDEA